MNKSARSDSPGSAGTLPHRQQQAWLQRHLKTWNLHSVFSELLGSVRSIGPRRTWSVLINRLYDIGFDMRYGTRTIATHDLQDLGITSANAAHGQRHQPSAARAFSSLCRLLELKKSAVLIDFGSGLGRVLLLAMRAGMAKAIGVEFSPELARASRMNVETFRHATGSRTIVEVHEHDAALWVVPDEADVFYFFHPFGPPVLRPVLKNISASLRRQRRHAWLIYYLPRHEELLAEFPEWRLSRRLVLAGYSCSVFEARPA